MARNRFKLAALILSCAAGVRADTTTLVPDAATRSDDPPEAYGLRDRFIHEARPDPLRKEYEELFGEQWPDVGWHPLARFKPFEDVQKFNDAVERRYFEPLPTSTAHQDNRVSLRLRLPEGQAETLDVFVNDRRVLVSFAPKGEGTGKWRFYKRREQSLPLPDRVDPDSAKITREGDVVTITFLKRG